MNKTLVTDKERIADFCRRHNIDRLAIFGSALRSDFGPDSDIDVLVDFIPGHAPGFFRLFDMEEELSVLFAGRKVDMRTPEDLSRYFRDQVVASAEVQYVRG
ncbi:MAG: nucleotidyltransferase family protein [Planctomycetota bacterium]